jgi:hypothetical protein
VVTTGLLGLNKYDGKVCTGFVCQMMGAQWRAIVKAVMNLPIAVKPAVLFGYLRTWQAFKKDFATCN